MLLLVLFFLAALAGAQDLDSPARELARKITVAAGRQDIALTVRNSSSLSEAEAAQVTRALEAELRTHAQRPGGDRAPVNVTLSENVQSYLWIAQIQQTVVMLTVPRPSAPASPSARVGIRKKLLWEQEKPILDATMLDSLLIVLDPASVAFYRDRQLVQQLAIPSDHPLPRDPRGHLVIERDSFRAFLPGILCSGSITPTPSMNCAPSTAPWPLDGGSGGELAVGRNYFTEPRLPPFFSTATLTGSRLVASVDGRARIYDGTLRETGQLNGWGSDIAAIDSGCRADRLALASRPGEAGESDILQAYDVDGHGAVPAGDPATFPGPVTALWPSGRTGEAVAIARNAETGRYAAYSLAITCDR